MSTQDATTVEGLSFSQCPKCGRLCVRDEDAEKKTVTIVCATHGQFWVIYPNNVLGQDQEHGIQ